MGDGMGGYSVALGLGVERWMCSCHAERASNKRYFEDGGFSEHHDVNLTTTDICNSRRLAA